LNGPQTCTSAENPVAVIEHVAGAEQPAPRVPDDRDALHPEALEQVIGDVINVPDMLGQGLELSGTGPDFPTPRSYR
jgi:hypothetical protein